MWIWGINSNGTCVFVGGRMLSESRLTNLGHGICRMFKVVVVIFAIG
jgi:hypothetical protein